VTLLSASESDHAVAVQVAQQAGELLVNLLQSPVQERRWGGLEYEGDRRAHRFIVDELRRLRPDDVVLSEEGSDDRARLGHDRVWIVDPLDGSSDFGYSPHWAVHVALVSDGQPVAGAVAVPGWEQTWGTDPAPVVDHGTNRDVPRVVVARSRSRFDGFRIQQALGAEIFTIGSAGVKAMAVVRGEVDAYVHGGGLYEWDICAPAAVASAAGLVCCHVDGSPLSFNKPDVWSPGLIISRPDLIDDLLVAMTQRMS